MAENAPAEQGTGHQAGRETTQQRLAPTAHGGEVYLPRYGRTHRYPSFDIALALKLDTPDVGAQPDRGRTSNDAVTTFNSVTEELAPQAIAIVREMKKLGISKDLLMPPDSLGSLAQAVRADQLAEGQVKDYPKINNERYMPDPRSPLYEIRVTDGQVSLQAEHSDRVELNTQLHTQELLRMLQTYYDTSTRLAGESPLASDTSLYKWVERQAINRSILAAKGELKPSPLTLEGATEVRPLDGGRQFSNELSIWQTPEGRKLAVKRAPAHTLQAEVLENRLMQQIGVPVPETHLEMHNGELVLIVGFLDAYVEENDPFKLSQEYQTSRVLQRGLMPDLLLTQYNRRPHNVMMKDGKVAFIDHGAAAFCRATGGFKEFSADVGVTQMWDILRTIPDDNPNGDVPVNEAYANILTVEGGPQGKLVIKDLSFVREQVDRLDRVSDEQLAAMVDDAGYEDGEDSIAQMREWIDSDKISGKIAKLKVKLAHHADDFTEKDARDLRWTQGAQKTMEDAIAAGGMKTYMTNTLIKRRDNLVKYLRGEIIREMRREEVRKEVGLANAPHRPEKVDPVDGQYPTETFSWESVIPELRKQKEQGKTIVITNGHFVFLHLGHSVSFQQAREVGQNAREDENDNGVVLLAIVNSDHQTHGKGREGPIKSAAQSAYERAANVYDNRRTDFVVISQAPQGDQSVVSDMQRLADEGIIDDNVVYFKAAEYSPDPSSPDYPPEARIIDEHGGHFVVISDKQFSTTDTVAKMFQAAEEAGLITRN